MVASCLVASVLLALPAGPPRARPSPTATRIAAPLVVLDRVEVVVGEEVLLESDIDRLVGIGFLPRRPGESDEAYRDRTREARIVDVLREQELRRTGALKASPAAVNARLAELEASAARDGTTFDERLARAGLTRAEVASLVGKGLALEGFVRERVGSTVRVTEADMETLYASEPFQKEALRRGVALVPYGSLPADVKDQLRTLAYERKLNEAVERWTAELRSRTRIVVHRPGADGPPAFSEPAESR